MVTSILVSESNDILLLSAPKIISFEFEIKSQLPRIDSTFQKQVQSMKRPSIQKVGTGRTYKPCMRRGHAAMSQFCGPGEDG